MSEREPLAWFCEPDHFTLKGLIRESGVAIQYVLLQRLKVIKC